MSTTKTKEELTRLAWIAALRRNGHRKCEGQYATSAYPGEAPFVCALGLLLEVSDLGLTNRTQQHSTICVGEMAGLTEAQVEHVIQMNDGGAVKCGSILVDQPQRSFDYIADVVEGWFDAR